MKKIPTLFRRDPEDMRRVLPEVTPGCEWVLAGEGVATRKYDGTCVMLDADSHLEPTWFARREVKPGKEPPSHFRPVETDPTTGKTVGWEPIEQSPFAKFHAEALNDPGIPEWPPVPGTYELLGPKINRNPEGFSHHTLVRHADAFRLEALTPELLTFTGLRYLLTRSQFTWEGIVWHHPDGRMAKLKVRDFAR